MNNRTIVRTSGRDHYGALYRDDMDWQASWLRRGAVAKVDSIEMLLHKNDIRPHGILELGCGVGAVIAECRRRELASRYLGVDYSQEALDYLTRNHEGINVFQGDITDSDFTNFADYDVVIVSHVLEHLENPTGFLEAMRHSLRFSHAVVEVPLENLLASRVKARFRDRLSNSAGHVQFFDANSFEDLLRLSGFQILDRRTYVPVLEKDTLKLLSEKYEWPVHMRLLKLLSSHYLPRFMRTMWGRFYYAHHAVLCTKHEDGVS